MVFGKLVFGENERLWYALCKATIDVSLIANCLRKFSINKKFHQAIRILGIGGQHGSHLKENVGLIHIPGEEKCTGAFGGNGHAAASMVACTETDG